MIQKVIRALNFTAALCLVLLLITTNIWQPVNPTDTIRPATRPYEFGYFTWTLGAFWDKVSMAGLGIDHYLTFYQDRQIVKQYFTLLRENDELQKEIEAVYSDPEITDPGLETADLQTQLGSKHEELVRQSSLAEGVIPKTDLHGPGSFWAHQSAPASSPSAIPYHRAAQRIDRFAKGCDRTGHQYFAAR